MKRTLVLGTAWTASAVAAVGLGFLAVSLVDADASPGTVPLAATGTSASATSSAAPAPSGVAGEQATAGGTVFASCDSGTPVLASAPAAGWWIDDSPSAGEVEFRDGSQKVEVRVLCSGGVPTFSVEGPRADDRSGGDDSSPAASTSSSGSSRSSSSGSSSSASATPDDSSGRTGGGHGSDDPAGDDSSGRGGGGHGSDD